MAWNAGAANVTTAKDFRRRAALRRRIADFLVDFTEAEVDDLLSEFDFPITRGGWGNGSKDVRREQAIAALANREDKLEALAESLGLAGETMTETEREPARASLRANHVSTPPDAPIFVVHGHDHAFLHLAVRVLERSTDREVIVLHEQANTGRSVLEKFETHATAAGYAVVLLTGDDKGCTADSATPQPRGRQNVIFELGYFRRARA